MKRYIKDGEIFVALAKSQAEFPKFEKGKQAYNYKYLDLESILSQVLPILGKNGLAVMQEHRAIIQDELPFVLVNSQLCYKDEYIEHSIMFPLGEPNKGSSEIMQFGSVATYLRRFALAAMLGIAGGDKDIEQLNDEANDERNSSTNKLK